MTFVYNRRFWDTANLVEFKTGNPVNPSIFVTPNFAIAFVITADRQRNSLSLRRISPDEIAKLAARFGLDRLQQAFPLPSESRLNLSWPSWLGGSTLLKDKSREVALCAGAGL